MEKLAIVCGSPSSEMLAPFEDESYEVWVLGNRCDRYPRFTRIFEIHDDLTQHSEDYPLWLSEKGVPLVVGENFPIKGDHIEPFPYDQTQILYGSTYLTSSSACMLAYALLEGFDHIELYGVDMAVDDHEYFWQRPCMESWVGFAKGRGVTVVIPEASPLGKSGYIEGRDFGKVDQEFDIPENEYSELAVSHQDKISACVAEMEKLEQAKQRYEELKLAITAHDGARQAYERMAKVKRAMKSGQNVKLNNTMVIK